MTGVIITCIIMTIFLLWALIVIYNKAYKRKWGNEESVLDPIPEPEEEQEADRESQ